MIVNAISLLLCVVSYVVHIDASECDYRSRDCIPRNEQRHNHIRNQADIMEAFNVGDTVVVRVRS
jgi:hypothetical protein